MSAPHKTAKQDETLQRLIPRSWEELVAFLEPRDDLIHSDLIVKVGNSHWRIDPQGELFDIHPEVYRQKWSAAFRYALERR